MKVKDQELEFEWDQWNRNKIYEKHGITVEEVESVFEDEQAVVLPDIEHSQVEER